MRWLLLLMFAVPSAWPTTCHPSASAPACEILGSADTVFLATILDLESSPNGSILQYLARIDEKFKGILPQETEVFLEAYPGARLQVGKQYLILTDGAIDPKHTHRTAIKIPFPSRWAQKRGYRTFGMGPCTPVREASQAAADLAWLRSPIKPPSRVSGHALQWHRLLSSLSRAYDPVLPDVQITLSSKAHTFQTRSAQDGSYRFDGIPPGAYTLTAMRPPWDPALPQQLQMEVNGCAVRNPVLRSKALISGKVVAQDGKPVKDIRVEVVQLQDGGKLAKEYVAWRDTDDKGLFRISESPAGDFVLGVNIHSAPTTYEPYATTYFQNGRRLHVEPDGKLENLIITLPPPLKPRTVTVKVLWADGTPVTEGAQATASHQGRLVTIESAKSVNRVLLPIHAGLEYEISARQFGRGTPFYTSKPVRLPAGDGPATIVIRLNREPE